MQWVCSQMCMLMSKNTCVTYTSPHALVPKSLVSKHATLTAKNGTCTCACARMWRCSNYVAMETIASDLEYCVSIVQAVGCRTPICCLDAPVARRLHAQENNSTLRWLMTQSWPVKIKILRIGPETIWINSNIFELITTVPSAASKNPRIFLVASATIYFENVPLVARRRKHFRGFWAIFLVAQLPPRCVLVWGGYE